MNNYNIPVYELNEDNFQHYASITYDPDDSKCVVNNEVQDEPKIEEITMEAILGMKYRKGKVQYLVKWETIDEAEWIEADKCDKQLIKKYLDKSEESTVKKTKSNFIKRENNQKSLYEFKKVVRKDDCDNPRKDAHTRFAKLCKGDWEDQVVEVKSMFRDVVTGEWYSLLKWRNGSLSTHPNNEANIKCPQKIISFYESQIVFEKKPKK